VGLERTEARIGKDCGHEPAKTPTAEVLVSECKRHVREEDRVVAVGFHDQGRPVWFENTAVFGQSTFG
jgi:hypothetical protein